MSVVLELVLEIKEMMSPGFTETKQLAWLSFDLVPYSRRFVSLTCRTTSPCDTEAVTLGSPLGSLIFAGKERSSANVRRKCY